MMKLTPKQAAAIAGVSVKLVYIWCEEKRLRHFRMGSQKRRGRILIESSDLSAFMETCRVEPETREETRAPSPKPAGFTQLDPARLLSAWRQRGAIASPQDGCSPP
jgi:excisionase family DNA binding protein